MFSSKTQCLSVLAINHLSAISALSQSENKQIPLTVSIIDLLYNFLPSHVAQAA